MKIDRGKIYDAIVTVKVKIDFVCDDYDMSDGDSFESITKMMIESEGLCGLIDSDDIEIVGVQQVERLEAE